jgi:D-alanyl-D-alanine carboxypeptidase
MVMDARTGEVLHSRNADTRLHPASLTKMMTLYIAFEAVRLGEIDLDTQVRISANAAAEPPSKLGLRAGSTIRFRFLIRAAAIRSANDAATAIAEAISGSEAAFARRMNRTARALGMTRTTFRNAHGLTEDGHMSTARDMTLLGRRLVYDYPQYYNIFSRREDMRGHRAGAQHEPARAERLCRRRRDQDGLYPRGGLQPRRLRPARAGTDHRDRLRRALGGVAQPADHGTSGHGLRPRAIERTAPRARSAKLRR